MRSGMGALASRANRVAAFAILAFLPLHIVETSFAVFAPSRYDAEMRLYRLPPFVVAEYLLVAAVIYHMLWGTFVMVVELAPWTARWRFLLWTALAAGYAVALFAVALIMIVPLFPGGR
jgi:hypothetical protein